MQIGMIGLGKMGGNMARRLAQGGHQVVGWDPNAQAVAALSPHGVTAASSLEDLVAKLSAPRAVWVMAPAGGPTEQTLQTLAALLSPGDVLIDGGNSRWTDSKRHAEELSGKGLQFLDVGTSGGIWGLERGYNMMVGGPAAAFEQVEPLLGTLCQEDGLLHVGPSGSGHYVKMVHNAIEYGVMQAIGEGFEALQASEYGPSLDFRAIADLWNHGSVIQSWLMELTEKAFAESGNDLAGIAGVVADSGEGRWTLEDAIEHAVPMPVLAAALFARFRSRTPDAFGAKVLNALRHQFGGHAIEKGAPTAQPAGAANARPAFEGTVSK